MPLVPPAGRAKQASAQHLSMPVAPQAAGSLGLDASERVTVCDATALSLLQAPSATDMAPRLRRLESQ